MFLQHTDIYIYGYTIIQLRLLQKYAVVLQWIEHINL